MTFSYTEEQKTLSETFRKSLESLCTSEFIRNVRGDVSKLKLIENLFKELGFFEYLSDESASFIDLMLIAREAGRTLSPMGEFFKGYLSSFLPRVHGVNEFLSKNAAVSFLFRDAPQFIQIPDATHILLVGDDGLLSKACIVQAGKVDSLKNHTSIDCTDFSFTGKFSQGTPFDAVLSMKIKNELSVLYAAECLGIGEKLLEITVEYVKVRKQYGRTIGSFQAVQHQLAESLIKIESAWALIEVAGEQVAKGLPEADFSARAALTYAVMHMPQIIETCMQLHGGIGFTWEYDLHLYLRRALKLQALAGFSESALIALCVNTSSG